MGEPGGVSGRKRGEPAAEAGAASAWPLWARALVSAGVFVHLVALLAAALAAPPSSPLERAVGDLFQPYYQLLDQGYSYRFYAPEPGPTPVVTARLRFEDGREETVRLPERGVLPRLRYQRQLALANHLADDFGRSRRDPDAARRSGPWARSYARHLARTRGKDTGRGCASVTLYLQSHLIPDPEAVVEAGNRPGAPVDLDAEEFYTTPERIGEFPCDGL